MRRGGHPDRHEASSANSGTLKGVSMTSNNSKELRYLRKHADHPNTEGSRNGRVDCVSAVLHNVHSEI